MLYLIKLLLKAKEFFDFSKMPFLSNVRQELEVSRYVYRFPGKPDTNAATIRTVNWTQHVAYYKVVSA